MTDLFIKSSKAKAVVLTLQLSATANEVKENLFTGFRGWPTDLPALEMCRIFWEKCSELLPDYTEFCALFKYSLVVALIYTNSAEFLSKI